MKPSLETIDEVVLDTSKPFDFENYIRAQVNYVHDLWEQAKAKGEHTDVKGVSAFMISPTGYFAKGYDVAYRQYYCGLRHKPKWGELK